MESTGLFETVPNFLPILEADETIFSWGGRYHRRSGNARAEDSSRILFGNAKAGLFHDFPSHLEILSGIIGQGKSGKTLALEHTVLGALAKFLDQETVDAALTMMLGESVSGIKHRLGLLKSGVGASHPLKACQDCMALDMEAASGPRWRVEHQWPSVWICRRHGIPLVWISGDALCSDRKRWLLPDGISKRDWIALPPISEGQLTHLYRLASLTYEVATASVMNFDPANLRLTYLLGANELGLVVTSDGSIRFKEMLAAVNIRSADLVTLPGWGFLSQTDNAYGGFVGLLLRQYPGNHHLCKHIALIDFLFESFEKFIATYRTVTAATTTGTLDELRETLSTTRRQVLSDVKKNGVSVTKAAANAGVQPAQAVAWIKRAGISYNARPRVLDSKRKTKLLRMLRAGRTRDEISKTIGVKKSWLRTFLAANVEIRDRWVERLEMSRRENYRKHFLGLIANHVGVPMKRIKAIPGNGFSWLYNNDREWLMANLPVVRCST